MDGIVMQALFEQTQQNLASVINDVIQQGLPTFIAAIALQNVWREAQAQANAAYQQYMQQLSAPKTTTTEQK